VNQLSLDVNTWPIFVYRRVLPVISRDTVHRTARVTACKHESYQSRAAAFGRIRLRRRIFR
jgi:hypothetical protein